MGGGEIGACERESARERGERECDRDGLGGVDLKKSNKINPHNSLFF